MNNRIYSVHDEIKDKHFELELGWIGKGIDFTYQNIVPLRNNYLLIIYILATEGKFQFVPKQVFDEAEKYAKVHPFSYILMSNIKIFYLYSIIYRNPWKAMMKKCNKIKLFFN